MYSNAIILLRGNFRHAHTHHERARAGLPKQLPPRAWCEVTRNQLCNPGVKSLLSNGKQHPKNWLLNEELQDLEEGKA